MSDEASEREIYQLDGCHDHGSDEDGGVPFWLRAPITESQWFGLRKELETIQKAAMAVVEGFEVSDIVLQEFEQRVMRLKDVLLEGKRPGNDREGNCFTPTGTPGARRASQ